MVEANGFARPVLVGGAAVEFYTGGAVVSGDFDIVAGSLGPIEAALIELGFVRENRQGHLLRGLYHPALLIGWGSTHRALGAEPICWTKPLRSTFLPRIWTKPILKSGYVKKRPASTASTS